MTEYEELCIKHQKELAQSGISAHSRGIKGENGCFIVPWLTELCDALNEPGSVFCCSKISTDIELFSLCRTDWGRRIEKASTPEALALKVIAILNGWDRYQI